MEFINQAMLEKALAEQAKTRHKDLWGKCAGTGNPAVKVTRQQDGRAVGTVKFYVPSKVDGGDVIVRTSSFICHEPSATPPVWSSTNDWND